MKIQELHFLAVDDMRMIRIMVKNQLKKLGVTKISIAVDGQEAWDLLKASKENGLEKPDFIISDWNMPNMKGVELLKLCRADDYYKDIPFLMLTSETEIGIVKEVIAAGVDGYVLKPFTPDKFNQELAKVYKRKILDKKVA